MKGFRVYKEQHILQIVPQNSRILHVGCTNSPNTIGRWNNDTLLHKKICTLAKEKQSKVIGIDIDQHAINFLREKMPEEKILNLDAHDISTIGENFDFIIAGDVIEHLHSPGVFLQALHKVMNENAELIITTANAYNIVRFLKAFLFHEAVHNEHTAYYSHKTLDRLLRLTGYDVDKFGYYKCEPLSGFSINRIISNLIENIVCTLFPQFSEGVFIIARKAYRDRTPHL